MKGDSRIVCKRGHIRRGVNSNGYKFCLICKSIRKRLRYASDPVYRQEVRDKNRIHAQQKRMS